MAYASLKSRTPNIPDVPPESYIYHLIYLTIKDADGTNPSSLRLAPKSTSEKTFLGKFCVKLWTSTPLSWDSDVATSKSVVSTGNDLWTFPPGVCNRSLVSVYADAGFDVAGTGAGTDAAAPGSGTARPSRSAFSAAAFTRRSSLSAAIFALILALASISSCFSLRFLAASFICSFF